MAEVQDLVDQDVLAPGTYQTYRYQYDKNLEPRIGELRLTEASTPRVTDVIKAIRDEVGAATAKTCKSILTGAFHGRGHARRFDGESGARDQDQGDLDEAAAAGAGSR